MSVSGIFDWFNWTYSEPIVKSLLSFQSVVSGFIKGGLSMRIVGLFYRHRAAWVLGLIGVVGLASGCGGDPNAGGVAPPTADTKAQQDAERAAREKAFGTGAKANNPGKAQAPKASQ